MNVPHLYVRLELFLNSELIRAVEDEEAFFRSLDNTIPKFQKIPDYTFERSRDSRTPVTAEFNWSWSQPYTAHIITLYNPPVDFTKDLENFISVSPTGSNGFFKSIGVRLFAGWQTDTEKTDIFKFFGFCYYAPVRKRSGESSVELKVCSYDIRAERNSLSFESETYREAIENVATAFKRANNIKFEDNIENAINFYLDHKVKPFTVSGTQRDMLQGIISKFNEYLKKELSAHPDFQGERENLISGYFLNLMFYNEAIYIYHKNLFDFGGKGKDKHFVLSDDDPVLRGESGLIEYPTKTGWYTWEVQSVFRPDIQRPLQNIKVFSRIFNKKQVNDPVAFESQTIDSKVMKILNLSHSIGWNDATTTMTCADSVYGFANTPTSPVG